MRTDPSQALPHLRIMLAGHCSKMCFLLRGFGFRSAELGLLSFLAFRAPVEASAAGPQQRRTALPMFRATSIILDYGIMA